MKKRTNTQTVTFAVEQRNGVIQNVSRAVIEQPVIKFNGTGIKWYDESKLLKKDGVNHAR